MHEFEELIIWLDNETAKGVNPKRASQKQKSYSN